MPKLTGKFPLICDWCKKTYMVYPSIIRKQKKFGVKKVFCCRKHKYEWNKTVTGYWKGKKMSIEAKMNMAKNHADFSREKNGRWKGGRRIDKTGYILILKKEHPYSDYHGYVREHRLVMEKKIGRILAPQEVVHHINHDRQDNRPENLILLSGVSEHQKLHYENGDSTHLKNYKK